ncbi:hypothetical protein [Amphiplicatus metriothermophilus]|uniref:Uncharacterized protein n=1 Tax=Amphiplicatus metriothermophilus TaxID=1519374 RepID=A0A239PKD7_9PROT|nr:hypothetical protein [Amphiplicatus metriothermophilus]MBB5518152.1 hypothetical protein [Amphiplicatus metriothermophilus]SNT67514.1 hypothetical protein SAMN06297382_0002 [Amphiplicatus metriothermophilus]
MSMRNFLVWPAKAALVFIALIAAVMIGGAIIYAGAAPAEGVDQGAMMRAAFAVHAANALMLSVLAARMRLSRVGAAALLLALFFCAQTLLSVMELAYFRAFFDYPLSALPRDIGAGFATAFAGAGAAALAFVEGRSRETVFETRSLTSLVWRFVAASALYPVAYWAAGLFFVTPSETARAFYGENFTDAIEPGALLALQLARGAIWAALAFAAAYGLRGSRIERAILVGASFSIFMILPLLYPNAIMPAPVRMLHFVEIATSNFIYGLVATLLLAPRRAAAQPYA